MVDGRTTTGKIVNQLKQQPPRDHGENRTPIATDMYLPNHSGISDHPEHNTHKWTDTGGLVVKGVLYQKEGITNMYVGEYLGFDGIVNPIDGGSIFFGIATDALSIQSYLLLNDDDVFLEGATLQFGSGTTNPPTRFYCNTLGFYGVTPTTQMTQVGNVGGHNVGAGAKIAVDDTFEGSNGTSGYTIGEIIDTLKLLGFMAM